MRPLKAGDRGEGGTAWRGVAALFVRVFPPHLLGKDAAVVRRCLRHYTQKEGREREREGERGRAGRAGRGGT